MIDVELKLYGAFRKYEKSGLPLRMSFKQPVRVSHLKEMIAEKMKATFPTFTDADLVIDSAIATDSQILNLDDEVATSCALLILPPVCGG